jgi:PAS domain S-box-containing protein
MDTTRNFYKNKKGSIDPKNTSTKRLFIILIVGIFLSEVVAMIIIYYVGPKHYWIETLLDATIMITLVFPMVYYFHFRALMLQITERKRSEALLTNVLENLPVGVWITDQKGQVVHGNPASHKIWAGARYVGMDQYSEYKAWWLDSGETIEPQDWAAVRAIRYGEVSIDEEIEIECFDGSHKIIANSAVPIYEKGIIQGAIVVNQDISERKRAEQELMKSEALFKTAFQILPVGAWLTDTNGKIIYGNPAGQEIWAGAHYVGIEQFGEYKAWWLNTGKPIEPEEWAVARAIKGETSLNEEIEIECFDGTHKIILNSAIPVKDDQQRFHGVFVVNQDITHRKQNELALRQSNELIERAFNSIDIMIAYMDRNFNFLRVNEAYARSAGHPVEFLAGKNHFELYPHEENQAIFQHVVDCGEPYSVFEKPFEYAEYPERGVTYWNWRVQPVLGADGLVQGIVLSLVDVTERKRAQLLLERHHQELEVLSIAEHKQRQLAETLNAVSLALSQSLDLETVMNTLLEYVSHLVPSDYSFIVIAENDTDVSLRSVHGQVTDKNLSLAIDNPFDGRDFPCIQDVLVTQKSLLIPETREYPGWKPFFTGEVIRNWLGIPLLVNGKVFGVLTLAQTEPGIFDEEHVRLAEAIVIQAAVAIQNAWLFEQVRAGHERLQLLSRRLVEVQESERRYIARELHDEASQTLTALMFGLQLLEQEIEQPDNLRTRVAELKRLTDEILENLHRLAIDLRPASLDYLGLVTALEQLVRDIDARYPLKVRFKAVGFDQEVRLADYVETALYRIVQEALTNTIRHSQANNVDVILELKESTVTILVEDDGVGFDSSAIRKSGHLGLLGMQERAQMLAGTMQVESSSGCGTTIVVEVPCANPNLNR